MKRNTEHLKQKIREILDFPTPGIKFKDITPLLEDPESFKEAIDGLVDFFRDIKINKVVGIDARGFLLASAVAYLLNAGMVIVRKKGKLPHQTIVREHDLEYGRGTLEIHVDAIKKGERVLVIDDVLATGGTADAAVKLVEHLGGDVVGLGFLLELSYFPGREKLKNYNINSLIIY
ncbi:MAG: Adenine phosphoribosyltransferase [Candidatus Azambacteria bacterium GW2011_GWB2_46_37]|uniref:Adenine phosphoribosyltransferase n=2 Tax=Candidatus Azamiibacteriota TaxID=1752741 RepID=A0A0G1T163_9BACT|nr:MAG: Adenine phosphoribosyltransferase [Candidatus Azambacteria bacterium GW2011_GWB2_46_37]KKU39165.1 MAG: Adenine phosphoribosyltransferase [Candidatus Azambacteria bacterium GW2011_GWE2_46_45]HAM95875.1 adenine phosphoribosyltransferase [Candidatus Azambacteria bacterium]HAQ05704.1 adenine phosphoribosyltransferase [Candidatus Azambacteria bacterium]HBA52483.1 adenine phosphoribosyltransferase [Candidatus Azambacteria bacterium]